MIFVCFLCVVVCTVGWSQGQSPQIALGKQARGIPGYLDPQTGTFTTRPQTVTPNVATTNTIFRLIFNFHFQYNDQPSSNVTACEVSISPVGDAASVFINEDAVAISADGGQSCQVTILASWPLATASSDTISMNYVIHSYQTVSGVAIESSRTSSQSLASIPMLANGETTTEPTINVVI